EGRRLVELVPVLARLSEEDEGLLLAPELLHEAAGGVPLARFAHELGGAREVAGLAEHLGRGVRPALLHEERGVAVPALRLVEELADARVEVLRLRLDANVPLAGAELLVARGARREERERLDVAVDRLELLAELFEVFARLLGAGDLGEVSGRLRVVARCAPHARDGGLVLRLEV